MAIEMNKICENCAEANYCKGSSLKVHTFSDGSSHEFCTSQTRSMKAKP